MSESDNEIKTAEAPQLSWSMSPSIGKLAEALAKAQLNFSAVVKDSENPYYKSRYADLATVIEATRKHLATEGISIIQMPHAHFNGSAENATLILTTLMAHTSGEWISSDLTLPAMMKERLDSQSVGSAITYARRYALSAMTGVAQEDDDGNKSVGIGSKEAANTVAAKKIRKGTEGNNAIAFTEWKEGFTAVSGENGLAIVKAETEPEELKAYGFIRDGNVLMIPVGKAIEFANLCQRLNVPTHWAESAKNKS